MHEHTFIQNIIRNIPDSNRVKSVVIELGELVGITADHLKEHLVQETGWTVSVSVTKSRISCSCGYIGVPVIRERLHDIVIFSCASCGLFNCRIIEGDKVKILTVNYD